MALCALGMAALAWVNEMILALNLNCSLDKIYTVPSLEYGGVVRAEATYNTAGGKGLHVANICRIMHEDYLASGFIGGHTGELIKDILDEKGYNYDFQGIAEETRSCINIGTPDGKQTEVLEGGPVVSNEEKLCFLAKYADFLSKADIVVGSGSLPKGLEKNFYGELIEMARSKGRKFLLDASGETLENSLPYKPFMIKPNKDEIEALTGRKIRTLADGIREAMNFADMDIKLPIVSLGRDGAAACWQGQAYYVKPPVFKAVNAVGSGDSFVAGIAIGLQRKYPIEEVLRLAAACGTANVLEQESGFVDPAKVENIMAKTSVEKVG